MTDVKMDHPDPTFWHASVPAGRKVYVWGGRTPNRGFGSSPAQRKRGAAATIDEFDTHSRSWSKRRTNGTAHPGLSQVASTSYNKVLYFYGGSDGKRLNGVLSQLDLETMDWSQLPDEPAAEDHKIVSSRPMRKDAAGMVYLKSTDGKEVLLVMCGYADPNHPDDVDTGGSSDKNSSFQKDDKSNDAITPGWTNEIQLYEFRSSEKKGSHWSVPVVGSGELERPQACADITLVRTAQQKAIFCGGFRTMHVYTIEFGPDALEIRPCKCKYPKNRLGQHAASCLGFQTNRPQLLMCGGRGGTSSSGLQNDIWMFDIEPEKWEEERISENIPDFDKMFESTARWGHTLTTVVHSDWLIEILMIGGSTEKYNEADLESFNKVRGSNTVMSLVYGFLGNEWVLLCLTDGEKWTFCKGTGILLSVTSKGEGETKVTKPMEGICIDLKQCNMKHYDFLVYCFKYIEGKYWSLNETTTVPLAMSTMAIHTEKVNKSISTRKNVGDLRGVDVCGETTIDVNKSGRDYLWKSFGFKLTIPEDSLPNEVKKCAITIKASISGQYQFPDDGHLVSAVFWLSCDPLCKFQKPITIEMNHCAKSGNAAKPGFVRAKCTQGSLPYIFKRIEGGQFSDEIRCGSIKLNGFSGLAVTSEEPRVYGAREYSIVQQDLTIIDFVVTWDTEAHLKAVDDEYMKCNGRREREIVFEFESDKISLDIPDDGIEIHEGRWKLIPLSVPEIKQRYVDIFQPGKIIPKCQFSAISTSGGRDVYVPPLLHKVNLTGTKTPNAYLMFTVTHPQLPATGGRDLPMADKLDLVIDAENAGVLRHAGRIADHITMWEGRLAEELGLTPADVSDIKGMYPRRQDLQKREALRLWKERNGRFATYRNLIDVFERASFQEYAEFTKQIVCTQP